MNSSIGRSVLARYNRRISILTSIDRQILRLAIPALGALIAEPLFLLTDTAMVGHLGAVPLAGLSLGSAVLQTAIGLLIFLAYATTPAVARRLGSGDLAGAIRGGIDGLWLALGVGVIIVVAGLPSAQWLVGLFGATSAVAAAGTEYLTISLYGVPAMLLVIAATGLFRGLQDTKTPLVVAVAGFAFNALLNAVLIYGLGMGIAGSALGTVIAQWAMAAVYLVIAVQAARRAGTTLRPGIRGVSSAAGSGFWLLLRTASLRAAMLLTLFVATNLGVEELATLQIALTVFVMLAFTLDALAIAGQAMIGHGLGSEDVDHVNEVTTRLIRHGLASGVVLGVAIGSLAWVLGPVFSSDQNVHQLLTGTVLVMALGTPLAGYVFVLDGVLIGAGDARYLAIAGAVNLLIYLPLLFWVDATRPEPGLIWLWAVFGFGYMGARALTLGLRMRGTRWLVTGASRST